MPRRLPLLLGIALVIGLGASCLHRAGPTERTDLPVYLAGAQEVLAGRDPFGVRSKRGWPYIYPPTFATLLIPLSPLPQRVAAGVWYLLSLAALIAGVLAFRRLIDPDATGFRWRDDGIPLALILLPAASALLRGQVSPLLLGLFGLGALALARERDLTAGLLLALAAAIKLTPALALGGLVAARRWKAAGGAAAGLVLWLVLVPLPFLGASGTTKALQHFGERMIVAPVAQPQRLAIEGQGSYALPRNQAPAAQLLKRLDPSPGRTALLLLLAGVALAAALALSARGEARPTVPAWALLAGAPLVALPLAWHHYHVLLFPALAYLVARDRRLPLAVFAVGTLLHFAVSPLRPFGLLGLASLVVLGAVVLDAWRAPATVSDAAD